MEFSLNFESDRLRLRQLQETDNRFFMRLISDPKVRKFLGGPVPWKQRFQRFASYRQGAPGVGIWVVAKRSKKKAIGLLVLAPHHDGVDYEVSYQFLPSHWGQGYAREAVKCILEYALSETSFTRIVEETQRANSASRRLLESLKMNEIDRVERFGAEQIIYASTSRSS